MKPTPDELEALSSMLLSETADMHIINHTTGRQIKYECHDGRWLCGTTKGTDMKLIKDFADALSSLHKQ
jgi:hypothetical protein